MGLGPDGFENEDKMNLHLTNLVRDKLGMQALTAMHVHFEDHEGERAMVVRAGKSQNPVFLKDQGQEQFYVRTGPSTTELGVSDTHAYLKRRFG